MLSGLTVQHWALLRRQMRFGAIAGLETAADVAGFAVAIAMALAGKGYWALVAQRLVSPAIAFGGELDGLPLATGAAGAGRGAARPAALRRLGDRQRARRWRWRAASTRS